MGLHIIVGQRLGPSLDGRQGRLEGIELSLNSHVPAGSVKYMNFGYKQRAEMKMDMLMFWLEICA